MSVHNIVARENKSAVLQDENSHVASTSSNIQGDILNISRYFSDVLLQNPQAVQQALKQCTGVDGSYNMCSVVDHLVRVSVIRNSLQQISGHAQVSKLVPSATTDVYGAKLIHYMLSKEKYFCPFQRSYYLLYQSFPPNPRRALVVIIKRYNVPGGFEAQILQQSSRRMCIQGLLNYLLIELRKDKNLPKFWETVMMIIEELELKKAVEKYSQKRPISTNEHLVENFSPVGEEHFACLSEVASSAVPVGDGTLKIDCAIAPTHSQKRQLHVCGNKVKELGNNHGVPISKFTHSEFYIKFGTLRMSRPNTFAILEKYHDQLLACFPEDYMITLEKISQKFPSPVPASAVELLTTPTTALAVNQRILAFLFSYTLVYDVNAKRGIFFSVAAALQEVAGSDKLEMCRQFQQELWAAVRADRNTSHLHRSKSSSMAVHNTSTNYMESTEDIKPSSFPRSRSNDITSFHSTPPHADTGTSNLETGSWPGRGGRHWVPSQPHPSQPLDGGYSGSRDVKKPNVFQSTEKLKMLDPKVIATLKKFYDKLWRSFPKDHMISLERCCTVHKLKEAYIDYITSVETSDLANQRLLDYMTDVIDPRVKETLLVFCSNLEAVIGSSAKNNNLVIEEFRNELLEAIIEESNSATTSPLSTPKSHVVQTPHLSSSPMSMEQQLSPFDDEFDEFDDMDTSETNEVVFGGMSEYQVAFNLIGNMPKDYRKTVKELRRFLTDAEVSTILASPNYLTANERIVTIVVINAMKRGGPLGISEILESVTDAPGLTGILKTFRRNAYLKMQGYNSRPEPYSATASTTDANQWLNCDEPVIFSVLQIKPKLSKLLKKHYDALWKSFPTDLNATIKRIDLFHMKSDAYPYSYFKMAPDISSANQRILDMFMILLFKPNYEKGIFTFVSMIITIIGDTVVTRNFEKDVLNYVKEEYPMFELLLRQGLFSDCLSEEGLVELPQYQETPSICSHPISQESVTSAEDDRDACLGAFDHCYDLMLKVNPRFAKKKFEEVFDFPNGDPLTGNLLFQPSEIQMEVLLVYARDAIIVHGVDKFFKLIDLFCSQEPYRQIGIYLLDTYHSKGGHEMHDDIWDGCEDTSVENLIEKLEYHNKQLYKYGLHYQPPKPLPLHYVPRPKQLRKITKAVLDNKSDTHDVDLVVEGTPGYGKTTIIKGLCCQQDMMQYFMDGFLWITLGPHPVKPAVKLSQIYHQLTATTITGKQDFLVARLKNLVTHLRWLLVIIDDVWEPNDVKVYLEVFGCCKVILLSCFTNLRTTVSSKHRVLVAFMEPTECLKLLALNGFENFVNEQISHITGLIEDVYYSPMLLNLICCQISMYCNKYKLSCADALQKIVAKLYNIRESIDDDNDCTAIEKATVETSLQLLSKQEMSRLNKLASLTGSVCDTVVLQSLLPQVWGISEEMTYEFVESMCSLGLLQYTEQLLLTETNCSTVPCVEIHTIIAQYLLVKVNPNKLTPKNIATAV